MFRQIALVAGALSLCGAAQAEERLIASKPVLDIQLDGKIHKGAWSLVPDANPGIYTVSLTPGQRKKICFLASGHSFCRTVRMGDQVDFIITHAAVDYPTRIITRPPAAVFDAVYRAENQGRVHILVPEVYELVNVAIALTPKGRNERYLVAKDTPYYADLMEYFKGHLDHPFVTALETEMNKDVYSYFRLKMNGYAFEFDANNRIIRSRIYDRTGFDDDGDNDLLPYMALMQSFADETNFRAFYRDHKPFYDSQITYYRDEADIPGMLKWLQTNFPNVPPYDSTKVIFSPLVNANQSLTTFESNGFTELQPHVNFPYPKPSHQGLSPRAQNVWRGIIVFGEMNHGFINLAAEPYAQKIAEIFHNRDFWVKKGTSSDAYQSEQDVFDEYMNWAINSPLFIDRLPPAEADELFGRLDKIMEGRGFSQFAAFNRNLVNLYRNRPPGTTVADLYPQIIAWCEQHQKEAAAS